MEVNIDYICAVIKENDTLLYKEFLIDRNNLDELLLMKTIVDDKSKSIIDLQDHLYNLSLSHYEHNVCIPCEYNNTYVDSPSLPERISSIDYKKDCDKKLENLLLIQKNKERKGENFNAFEVLERYKRKLKEKFFDAVYNYVLADEYISTVKLLKENPNLLIYSTETKGWASFNYRISEDIQIDIKTNFCYGSSSYFRVNLTYKGINILPYADIVKYYYARMVDWDRYTRQYRVIRNNWPLALNFVIEIVNLAEKDPDKFIEEWIKKELSYMMNGLNKILIDPEKELQFYKDNPLQDADNYVTVRNLREKDLEDFKVYPYEMGMAFKAYKISGALNFFENLRKLQDLYPFITEYINELKKINFQIQPEIKTTINEINKQLSNHEFEKKGLQRNLDKIEVRIKPYEKILESKLKGVYYKQHQKIREEYRLNNPRYSSLLEEQDGLQKKIWELEDIINERENFLKVLKKALELFEKSFGK